jgi:hypothetical protein
MTVTRSNLVTLAQTIGNLSATDSTATLVRYYDETLENLGKMDTPPLTYSSGLAVTTTARFAFPAGAIDVLALFHENTQLRPAQKGELDVWDTTWRGSSSSPIAYYKEEDDYNSIRMIPYPTTGTTGAWIYTKASTSDIPDYLALYICFNMLNREYARLSNHQDKEFATLCGDISEVMAKLIGI